MAVLRVACVASSALPAFLAFLSAAASASSPPASHCPPDRFSCPSPPGPPGTPEASAASGPCILAGDRCDGVPDCPGGQPGLTADEANCTACSRGAFLCRADGRCIRGEWRCDKIRDCSDGQDEEGCRPDGAVTWHGQTLQYPDDTFHCQDGQRRWHVVLCDGVQDCRDWADEGGRFCGGGNRRSALFRYPVCHAGAVQCGRSEGGAGGARSPCVPAKKVCDAKEDCPHGEDERNCSARTVPPESALGGGDPAWPASTPKSSVDAVPDSTDTHYILVYLSVVNAATLLLLLIYLICDPARSRLSKTAARTTQVPSVKPARSQNFAGMADAKLDVTCISTINLLGK